MNGYNPNPADGSYGTLGDNPTFGIQPYYVSGSSPTQYLKPDRFQIISAGQDTVFGSGGAWNTNGSGMTGSGQDDLSNFTRGKLSAGQ